MAMQAVRLTFYLLQHNSSSQVGRALEIWKDGEKSLAKPPAFSADNYGDTYLKIENGGGKSKQRRIQRGTIFFSTLESFDNNTWDQIVNVAHTYLPETKKRRVSSASTSTLVAEADDFEDPDTDFMMVMCVNASLISVMALMSSLCN